MVTMVLQLLLVVQVHARGRLSNCKPGRYSPRGRAGAPCAACPKGKYQPSRGQHFCYVEPVPIERFAVRGDGSKGTVHGKTRPSGGQVRKVRVKTAWSHVPAPAPGSAPAPGLAPVQGHTMCGNNKRGERMLRQGGLPKFCAPALGLTDCKSSCGHI